MNLASADPKIFKTSASTLRSSLNIATRIGAKGVIFHTGSHKGQGLDQVFDQVWIMTKGQDQTTTLVYLIYSESFGGGFRAGYAD